MKIEQQSTEKTLLVMVTGFVIIGLFLQKKSPEVGTYVLITAAAVGLLGVLFPSVGAVICKVWYKIAEVMGWIMSKVILTVVFFLFLTPIAFLYKVFNKDPLQLRPPGSKSLFHQRDHTFTSKDLKNPW